MKTRLLSLLAAAARALGLAFTCVMGWTLILLGMVGVVIADLAPALHPARAAVATLLAVAALIPLAAIVGVFVVSARRFKVLAGFAGAAVAAPLMYCSVVFSFFVILFGALGAGGHPC